MTGHRPVLIIIAGPNGSGKTTVTSKILKHEWLEDSVYINPDQVAQERFGDWNSPEAVRQAAEYCADWRERCLVAHNSMIFESVLSAQDKVDFVQRAIKEDFFIRLFFVCTQSPTINAARIAKRVMEGGHDVPISKVISRYNKSIVNCQMLSRLVDRAYIYDNSIDGQEARLLFRFADGIIIKRYTNNPPRWAQIL
jgi:predicted ABC-type ATPase